MASRSGSLQTRAIRARSGLRKTKTDMHKMIEPAIGMNAAIGGTDDLP